MPGQRTGAPNILLGIVRVACGRSDGLARFGGTRESFLASLAPLVAFPLVGCALMLLGGAGRAAATLLLMTFCAVLAPPVLSFEAARLWDRRAAWLRFATALNWCQWGFLVVAVMLIVILLPLLGAFLPVRAAGAATEGAVGCYGLWLHWFVARHGLALSRLRAAALVALVNLGTGLLVLGPSLLATS